MLPTVPHVECCERGSHRGLQKPRGRPSFDSDGGSVEFGRGNLCPSTILGPWGRRFALQGSAQLGEGVWTAKEESAIDSSFKVTHEGCTLCMDPAPLLGCTGRWCPTPVDCQT